MSSKFQLNYISDESCDERNGITNCISIHSLFQMDKDEDEYSITSIMSEIEKSKHD